MIKSSSRRIAALRGLLWMTPRFLVYGIMAGLTVVFKSPNNGGFQEILEAMSDEQDIDILSTISMSR